MYTRTTVVSQARWLLIAVVVFGCRGGQNDGNDSERDDRRAADAGSMDAEPKPTPDTVEAVSGERCPARERVGLIELTVNPGSVRVRANLGDSPIPVQSALALSTEACEFHTGGPPDCGGNPLNPGSGCAFDELCGADGKCVPFPKAVDGGSLTVRAGTEAQEFTGPLSGEVTVAGDALAMEVDGYAQRVLLPEMPVPGPLDDLVVTLDGHSGAPLGMDFSWTPVADGAQVHTLININHHVRSPTFTECSVKASVGEMHIREDMLTPLAVSTGLEFQGVDHIAFAAATTDDGCVEFRFRRFHFVFPQ